MTAKRLRIVNAGAKARTGAKGNAVSLPNTNVATAITVNPKPAPTYTGANQREIDSVSDDIQFEQIDFDALDKLSGREIESKMIDLLKIKDNIFRVRGFLRERKEDARLKKLDAETTSPVDREQFTALRRTIQETAMKISRLNVFADRIDGALKICELKKWKAINGY